ncbi:MAG TPA: hypothetical protein VJT31_04450, partial [Rugosimonospora sp.]|nr:hypothetical protein [Rugosimonospora sp.]
MGTYPCSNCGARADTSMGCPNCGRSVEQEITELSHVITTMQFRNSAMVDERQLLMKRLQGAIATRTMLRLATEQRTGVAGAVRPVRRAPTRTAPRSKAQQRRTPPTVTRQLPDGTVTITARPAKPGKALPMVVTAPGQPPAVHQPEASTGTMQNALLGLGALLFAATAMALSGYLRSVLGTGGREAVFVVLTIVALSVPMPLAKRSLTATAETVAVIGLVFVLLIGYITWSATWVGGSNLPATAYAGLVTFVAAGIAAAYRWFSHLIAPRFAAVLLLQPVLPLLLGSTAIHSLSGWGSVLAAVAAEDLALALVLRDTPDPRREGTPYLVDAVWGLHALAVLVGAGCSIAALAHAHTVTEGLSGAAALLAVAIAGLAGALLL